MQYLALIQKNAQQQATAAEWDVFFSKAEESGLFRGGSAIDAPLRLGSQDGVDTAEVIGGFMRFDADSREQVEALLVNHPVITHGGTIELYEMPQGA